MKTVDMTDQPLISHLKRGGIVVLPTDTLYGIHTTALNKNAVAKVYELRKRLPSKPFIILISDIRQISLFDIKLNSKEFEFLNKHWPGKISVIMPCLNPKFEYLHRGSKSLAFRLPDKKDLTDLINVSGPLISTSVNPEGQPPATTLNECTAYFGDEIEYYVDGGKLESEPSTVVRLTKSDIEVIREGAVKL